MATAHMYGTVVGLRNSLYGKPLALCSVPLRLDGEDIDLQINIDGKDRALGDKVIIDIEYRTDDD